MRVCVYRRPLAGCCMQAIEYIMLQHGIIWGIYDRYNSISGTNKAGPWLEPCGDSFSIFCYISPNDRQQVVCTYFQINQYRSVTNNNLLKRRKQ